MKTTIEQGEIRISIAELLESVDDDGKRAIADSLACEDGIIKDVADQILSGWTEAGSHGFNDDDSADPHYSLAKARREVALRAGEVAASQIKSLCRKLRFNEAYTDAYREWGFRLYHAWSEALRGERALGQPEVSPSVPPFEEDEYEITITKKDKARK